ncbi:MULTISPECIES: hypothetical protein [Mesorhizobium]|uniref:Uncharacterized protein n=1 Tax=Mesorhizobium erdmanii TaxID=1777866 RepID=A0A6M7ULP2_9HYPH|nr:MULTISPECIES: hypothetical protein [Mesorhizobium]OBQ61203.1 hypothetical protein A8146_17420 [Mesorhizobium loti]PBC23091.1 hypothetical protein CK226_07830 [Mesorhizobium sp. WSM4311]QKC77686.1 hypothetical protein EB233_21110 [Mesorhizobium erdmanii]TRD06433.1 hypothetical protein FJV82_06645 [Mesorhizobium sp. WSM4305]
MGNIDRTGTIGSYRPCAIYYEQSDSLEYVRVDSPSVYRRVDDFLTLILAMEDRSPIGFKLKGFRHFYLRHLKRNYHSERQEFLALVKIVEEALCVFGDKVFDDEKRVAYQRAIDIAQSDNVEVRDFPSMASHG